MSDRPLVLLLWDAPNVDMTLGTIVQGRPRPEERPRFDAVATWLLDLAGPDRDAEGAVFTNVVAEHVANIRPWVEAVRNNGFAVFAKPKLSADSDIDDDMLAHLARREAEGRLSTAVVVSGDGRAFREPLVALAARGVDVVVAGFREYASFALQEPTLRFVDLEDIRGVFLRPLPRVTLENLPPEGAWFAPLRPLGTGRPSTPAAPSAPAPGGTGAEPARGNVAAGLDR